MAVQFILGRSGTGKTSRCIGAIVDALLEDCEQPLIFLVPEQATYQAERAILSDERVAGFHRLHVLSFDRLQFLLLGKSIARPRISQIGRQMIVHKIVRDLQEDLRVFRSSALLPGFARQMAEMVTELHRYAQAPEDVEGLVSQLQQDKANRLSELKFADIALVFGRYAEVLEGRLVDPEAQLSHACRLVAQSDFVQGARLWVDGFAGFTGGELELLTEMLKVVDRAQIALCLDPATVSAKMRRNEPPTPDGLFEPTERTYFDLLERIGEAKLQVDQPVALEKPARFSACPSLAHVESKVFLPGADRAPAGQAIRLIAAPSLRAEIQFVARQIRDLVQKRPQDYRYRDIAVVASDLDCYEHYVRAYFDDYGIPFFIDKRKALNQHPVVELISAALESVIGGFAHADVFAYLKTDLVPIDPSRIDVLENYCLAFGVAGRDWLSTEPWRFKAPDDEAFDEDAVNAVRGEIVQPLRALREALCPQGDVENTVTPEEFTRAVFGLLDVLHVRQTMGRWIEDAQQDGDLTAADEHRQFFDRLVDIFDELVDVFGREAMTAQDYLGILHSAFSQMTLAFIPPSLDQVLVGSIERSRHPDLKAVFLLGATQKQFPVPIPSAGVLTDEDRDAAEALNFRLAPSSTQSLVERQYLAYIAFTRPSELLCISYPSVDEKGSPVVRSHFVDQLQSLFSDLAEESLEDVPSDPAEVRIESELGELLCGRLGRDVFALPAGEAGRLAALLGAMQSDREHAAIARSVTAALDYDNRAHLESGAVEALSKGDLTSSATRLGTFAACPYKYFSRYTLGLKPRREFKFEPLDLGRFYHRVLDASHKRLAAEGQNFGAVENEPLLAVLREQVAELVGRDPFISNFIKHSGHNAFIISNAAEVLEEAVLEIAQMVRAGAFRPVLSEVGFGDVRDAQDGLGRFALTLPDGRVLALNGKIDRLDVVDIDGAKVALVFDYKRTQTAAKFNWSEFYHGLDMQLPMYLLALSKTGAPYTDRVAGAFCVPIERAADSGSLGELAGQTDRFGRKARGLFDGDYYRYLDHEVDSGWSAFYGFYVSTQGDQYAQARSSAAIPSADFGRVLRFTEAKILDLAGGIVAGDIGVFPYRLGTRSACATCDYKAVCRFDWQVNDYRLLATVGKLDAMDKLKRT